MDQIHATAFLGPNEVRDRWVKRHRPHLISDLDAYFQA